MKVLIAQFQQETNSFSPVASGIAMFRQAVLLEGDAVLTTLEGTATEMAGFIDALREADAAIVPSVAAHAVSSGPLEPDAFEQIAARIERDALAHGPLDGILVCCHGAMLVAPDRDATGLLLARLRKSAGDGVVIAATLDLHANVTALMTESADILVGYRTYPHVDLYETGRKAADLLLRTLRGDIRPVGALVKVPMLVSGENGSTSAGPMQQLMERVREAEACEGALSVSVFQMQPWLDVGDAGCAVLAVTNGERELAESLARSLADFFWRIREQFSVQLTPLAEAVDFALSAERAGNGPVVFADSADGTGSGSPGDGTAIIRELLCRETNARAYVSVVDPETVERAIAIGVGNSGAFDIGGKIDRRFQTPVRATARVKLIGDGSFTFKGPQFTGVEHRMGRTAVLQIRRTFIVAMERPAFNWDPELYRSVGLEPRDADIVVVKSPTAFRVNYEPMASAIYWVDTPGASSANLLRMPFARLPQPMYPFQPAFEPHFEVAAWGHARPAGGGSHE
ncbi:M81 family metallopeptidase [Paenibacillus cymbidii]|uniref:M81 family metallopeptidase n=1 Tax=Paenibacillus cymbidii TaxID=1639034 RepID=UPI001080CA42|nr:M81 family metallopeptidase [Paenibacillus cymbidii]